jgi:hypothetical protein
MMFTVSKPLQAMFKRVVGVLIRLRYVGKCGMKVK